MTLDIKGFYLAHDMDRPEYIRIPLRFLSDASLDKHNLRTYISNKSILFEVNKTMYGLPQAGRLAQDALLAQLAQHGYHQTQTSMLFRHTDNGTTFSLVVDDFGVKYTNRAGAQHLIDTLQNSGYELSIDWEGRKYLGFQLDFATDRLSVALSLPGYIDKVLRQHAPHITRAAASPAVYNPPSYGAKSQVVVKDTSAPLSGSRATRLAASSALFFTTHAPSTQSFSPQQPHMRLSNLGQPAPSTLKPPDYSNTAIATQTIDSFSTPATCIFTSNLTRLSTLARKVVPSLALASTSRTTAEEMIMS